MSVFRFEDMVIDPQRYPWGYNAWWHPTELDPLMMLESDDSASLVLDSEGRIEEWRDKSANNYHASQDDLALRPTIGTFNDKNIIVFDSKALTSIVPFEETIALFAVVRYTGVGGSGRHYLIDGVTGNDRQLVMLNNSNKITMWAGTVRSSSVDTDTDWHLFLFQFDGGSSKAFRDSVEIISGNIGSSVASQGINIGVNCYLNQDFLGGDIAALIAIPGTMSSENRYELEGYYAHRWGLTGNLPVGHPYKDSAP